MKTNVSQVFLVYMALIGDVEKTALALNMDEAQVRKLEVQEGWAETVRRISVLSKSDRPGDYERAQNRALNFVQCHQLRKQVDRLIFELQEAENVVEKFIVLKESGRGDTKVIVPELSARFLSDLTASMDRIHAMTYAALGDSAKERTARGENPADPTQQQSIHSAVIGALTNANTPAPAPTLIAGVNAKVEQLKSAQAETPPA